MRATSIKALSTLLLVAAVAGCASKKADDTAATTAPVTPPVTTTPVEAAPVEGTDVAPVDTVDSAEPVAANVGLDGFESNPAHYTGDTRTRVIYFAFDKSDIPSAAYATLKAHAQYLAGNASAKLIMEGHADERGTPEYNVALAERRAKSVVNFLVLNGAKASQFEVVSYGEEKPAELGSDELSWAKNRRAFLNYTAGQP